MPTDMRAMDDGTLLKQAAAGKHAAFEQLDWSATTAWCIRSAIAAHAIARLPRTWPQASVPAIVSGASTHRSPVSLCWLAGARHA